MLLITFATLQEAQASLDLLKATPKTTNLYEWQSGLVLITGMGCISACGAICQLQALTSVVWNLGIAGSLSSALAVGDWVEIRSVCRHLSLPKGVPKHAEQLAKKNHPPFTLQEEGRSLLSSDYPIYKTCAWAQDLVDMEGYGVAWAAKQLQIPCRMGKLISDGSSQDDWKTISLRLPALSLQLSLQLESWLSSSSIGTGTYCGSSRK